MATTERRAEAKPSGEEEAKRSRRGEQKNLFPFSRVQEKSLSLQEASEPREPDLHLSSSSSRALSSLFS